ncbi:MAG: serpin family protein, partial [Thaumarchaeota archaeon]
NVDEYGTEASAVTEVMCSEKEEAVQPPKIEIFRADHPFVFMIFDNRTGLILFIGKLADPS